MKRLTLKRKDDTEDDDNNKNEDKRVLAGIADLAREVHFLSMLQDHPNMIRLRATAFEHHRFDTNYFLIIDRLYDTLHDRLYRWKKQQKRVKKS